MPHQHDAILQEEAETGRGVEGLDKFHLLFYGFFSIFAAQQIAAFFVPCAACSIIVGKIKSKIVSIRKQTTCKITQTDERTREGGGVDKIENSAHVFLSTFVFSNSSKCSVNIGARR